MNLSELFEAQKVLMDRIEKEHPQRPNENRFAKRVLAFIVELSECANDWRGFKFWSNNQNQKETTLEEYVDGLHFVMELGIETKLHNFLNEMEFPEGWGPVEEWFLDVIGFIHDFYFGNRGAETYQDLMECYIGLGAALGFTWEEIEQGYFAKNQINHTRQDSGY